MTYGKFRTGLDFATVQAMLWVGSDDSEQWKYKRRNTVLGLWMALKRDMWDAHCRECGEEKPK